MTDIENNPWHAYNHFVEAPYLGPSDRAAAETLWKRYRKLQKRVGRLAMIVDKSQARERLLLERVAQLEAAMAAMENSDEQ